MTYLCDIHVPITSLHPWSYSKDIWTWLLPSGSAWAGVLDQITSRGPFRPRPFCDLSLSLLSRALWIALGKQQDPVCCQDSPQWPWFLAGTTMSLQSSPQYKCRLTGKVLQQWRPSKTGWFGQTGSRQCFLITWQSAPCADPAQPQ